MKKLEKDLLQKQTDVFYAWGRRNDHVPTEYRGWLTLFVNTCAREDVYDVDEKDQDLFLEKAYEISRTTHDRMVARKSVESLRRYYTARNKNVSRGRGRPPHLNEIEKVKLYKKMGLKYREIRELTGKHYSWIHKAIHYFGEE